MPIPPRIRKGTKVSLVSPTSIITEIEISGRGNSKNRIPVKSETVEGPHQSTLTIQGGKKITIRKASVNADSATVTKGYS